MVDSDVGPYEISGVCLYLRNQHYELMDFGWVRLGYIVNKLIDTCKEEERHVDQQPHLDFTPMEFRSIEISN